MSWRLGAYYSFRVVDEHERVLGVHVRWFPFEPPLTDRQLRRLNRHADMHAEGSWGARRAATIASEVLDPAWLAMAPDTEAMAAAIFAELAYDDGGDTAVMPSDSAATAVLWANRDGTTEVR